MEGIGKKYCLLWGAICLMAASVTAQDCDNQYSSVIYKGINFNNFTVAAITSGKEIIGAGDLYGDNALIAKFSSKGNPIWSFQYNIPYRFNQVYHFALRFRSIFPTSDGGFIIAGHVIRVSSDSNRVAVLARIDKYGLVQWAKSFQSIYGKDLSIASMIETIDHDIVVYMGCNKGVQNFSYGKVIRMSNQGVIKWVTQLHTGSFDAGRYGATIKRSLLQKRNGNIVVGDVVYQIDRSQADLTIKESDLHFLELDYNTGKMNWETSYEYIRPDPAQLFIPDIVGITEQSDGKLRFFTSLMMPADNKPGNSLKGFSILTDLTGHIEDIIAYYPSDNTDCKIKQVITDPVTADNSILFDKNGTAVLTTVNNNGQFNWVKAYDNSNGLYPPNCMAKTTNGYAILMSSFNDWKSRLLLTDENGAADCLSTPMVLLTDKAALRYHAFSVITNTPADYQDPFETSNIELVPPQYDLQNQAECQKSLDCCKDVIDSVNVFRVDICEGETHLLPDNTPVKDSGTYYVTFKTNRGCDSIRYYNIHLIKNPAKLSLGRDTCLQQQTQTVLQATPGYESYAWMGITSNSSSFTISKPGVYWVRVSNSCGEKTDSIEVYKDCEFPIYMPTAFSPNHDNLNDYYSVPKQNINRFIRLSVINRWGQVIYKTTDQDKGWDGRYNGVEQDAGIFVYYLEMETLSGKRVIQKGTFALVK